MSEIKSHRAGPALVRALRDDEIAFCRAYSWVKAEALIAPEVAPEVAVEMLEIVHPIVDTPGIADKERRPPKLDDWGSCVAPYYNVANTGLKMGDEFKHARFPIIYPTQDVAH